MEVGSNTEKDDGRNIVHRKKKRRTLPEMDEAVADLRVMKIKQWMEKTKDREQWSLVVEEAKPHPGL
jgi:hypothetical protein